MGVDEQRKIVSQILDTPTGELTPEAKAHVDHWLSNVANLYGARCPFGHSDAATVTNKFLVESPCYAPGAHPGQMLFIAVTCTKCGHTELLNVMRVFSHLA